MLTGPQGSDESSNQTPNKRARKASKNTKKDEDSRQSAVKASYSADLEQFHQWLCMKRVLT
jgi:hypothetical protein